MTTPIHQAVNDAVRYGFAPLAIWPNSKKPKVKEWKHWQTRKPTADELAESFRSESNLALICGKVSGGLAVLDIDDPGLAYKVEGDIPLRAETTLNRTPRGGLHVWMIETETQSRSGPLVPGVADLKAEGGYILVPPSSIDGNEYKTLTNHNIMVVANAREKAIEILRAFEVEVPDREGREPVDVTQVLDGVAEGERDLSLFRLACKLRRADVPRATAEELVQSAAAKCSPPFPKQDALAKVASAYDRYSPAVEERSPSQFLKTTESDWIADADEAAFEGLAGDLVRAISPHTEADNHALLGNLLGAFGNLISPDAHFKVGQDRHSLRINIVLVGKTSHGRKGVSWAEVRGVLERVVPAWASERVQSGLSSGEGLIWAVRDPISRREAKREKGTIVGYQDVEVDPGIDDKRLLVVESEFARTLKVMGREGNILSAVIRQAWDSGHLRVLTRNSPAQASGAHISIIGHITQDELLRYLDGTEAANGFGNRFLWMAVRRTKLLPEGGQVPAAEVNSLVAALKQAVDFAANIDEMRRTEAASAFWASVYPELTTGRPGLYGALTGRAEAHVMRLACLYALLDFSASVDFRHLQSALAFWKRADESVRYVFGDATGDPMADTILRSLRAQGPMTQTAIGGLFSRHAPAGAVEKTLRFLQAANLVVSEVIETGGRPTTLWSATSAR